MVGRAFLEELPGDFMVFALGERKAHCCVLELSLMVHEGFFVLVESSVAYLCERDGEVRFRRNQGRACLRSKEQTLFAWRFPC